MADALVPPGVGAFRDADAGIAAIGLIEPVLHLRRESLFLGFAWGYSFCLKEVKRPLVFPGLLHGRILRIPSGAGLKIPHIGWNSLHF